MKRVRLAGALIQFQGYTDDGQTLEPVHIQPVQVTIPEFLSLDLDEITKKLQDQVDADEDEIIDLTGDE